MTIVRAQCSVWHDSVLPRDAITINPHFEDTSGVLPLQAFADALATYFDGLVAGTCQTLVKLYDAQSDPPNEPLAFKQLNTGLSPAAGVARELAVCLSYYSTVNVKRRRGRLYIPLIWLTTQTVGLRPNSSQRSEVSEMGNGLSAVGAAGWNWGLYSRADDAFRVATNTWVDDEWDTVRSRGLKSTARTLGTVTG